MMTKEQFARETKYETAMAAARAMLKNGIVNEKDYRTIDTIMRRKYRPIIGSLQPLNIAHKP
jgi:hypothetical protein